MVCNLQLPWLGTTKSIVDTFYVSASGATVLAHNGCKKNPKKQARKKKRKKTAKADREHRSGARESTRNPHEKGVARRQADQRRAAERKK